MAFCKSIIGFPKYEIDTLGRVWSWYSLRFLKSYLTRNYKTVRLCRCGKMCNKRIHRLVLENFVGKCPDGMEACHNNGNKLDNRLSNLRWDTRSNNAKDAVKHGDASCIRKGENSLHHKLTEQDVMGIWKLWWSGMYIQKEIAKVYNVHRTTISNIINNKSWKHIWR